MGYTRFYRINVSNFLIWKSKFVLLCMGLWLCNMTHSLSDYVTTLEVSQPLNYQPNTAGHSTALFVVKILQNNLRPGVWVILYIGVGHSATPISNTPNILGISCYLGNTSVKRDIIMNSFCTCRCRLGNRLYRKETVLGHSHFNTLSLQR